MLKHTCQYDFGLNQSVGGADAIARSAAERDEGVGFLAPAAIPAKTLRLEAMRLGPIILVPVG